MKKILLSLVLALGILSGCSSETTTAYDVDADFETGPEIEVQVGYSASDEVLMGQKFYQLAERVAEESNGKINIEIYPNGQLGGDIEMFEGVMAGNITAMVSTPTSQVSYIPELSVLDIGGLYKDLESCNKVMRGEFFDELSRYYEANGVKLIAMDATYFRQMTSNKAVRQFSDFSGIKIRTQENKYHTAYWSALGANPTPLAFSELYIGLQQGLVEAQENPIETMKASKLDEVQKYVIMTNHIPFLSAITMNLDFWNSLPTAYQDLLAKEIRQMNDELIVENVVQENNIVAGLVEDGIEIITLDDETLEQMEVGTEACIDAMKKDIDSDLVDRYVELARASAE